MKWLPVALGIVGAFAGGRATQAEPEGSDSSSPTRLLEREVLTPAESTGCPGLPDSEMPRELSLSDNHAVDVRAHFWNLDRPSTFVDDRSIRSYRVGSGRIQVTSRLSSDHRSETLTVHIDVPIEPEYRSRYLSGLDLPCTRTIRYERVSLPPESGDLGQLAAFDDLLLSAEELLYDRQFEAARRKLEQARALRKESPVPHWMLARLCFLEIEEDERELGPAERSAAFARALDFADAAIARAPTLAEGYLWRGIALGRRATALGNFRVALRTMLGAGGPAEIAEALERATTLPYEYAFFGSSTRADALYALAQFYRLAPDAWYMAVAGTRGDLDRALELIALAIRLQPKRIDFGLELAVEYACRDRDDDRLRATRELRRILALPALTPLDRVDQEHAAMLLAETPDNVCWYSRDGFQEPEA